VLEPETVEDPVGLGDDVPEAVAETEVLVVQLTELEVVMLTVLVTDQLTVPETLPLQLVERLMLPVSDCEGVSDWAETARKERKRQKITLKFILLLNFFY